ncbi:MAG TPA: hydrolase [Chromatiaceae bacterium]|nr:hydrolase [Chromatiaceae bacterium]
MPIEPSRFRPAWWLPGHHLPTLWPSFFRRRPDIPLTRERVELADGDFLDLSWCGQRDKPIVMLLHGLEGNLHSHYARPLLKLLSDSGYLACMMHFRGCSGEPNRLPRSYHSGDSLELQTIVEHIMQTRQRPVFAIIGFSLGANVLLKWLGERGKQAAVDRAMAVSVPFLLHEAADRLDRGFSRIYQRHLLNSLKQKYRDKFSRIPSPLDINLDQIRNFRQFDEEITAPLHGFSGADDYYHRCSCRRFIPLIHKPTLILHDRNDPFMWPHTVPQEKELPEDVLLELTNGGGHAGFVCGNSPASSDYWAGTRLLHWLTST